MNWVVLAPEHRRKTNQSKPSEETHSVQGVIEGLTRGCPAPVLLERNDAPNSDVDEGYPNDIEDGPNEHTASDFIDDVDDLFSTSLPLEVEHSNPNSHYVCRDTNVGLVVELVHKLWLRRELGVGNRVSPVVHHDHHKCSDY